MTQRNHALPLALTATACGALGLLLAAHHPLAPGAALAAIVLAGAVFLRWPHLWQLAVPGMLPWLDLSPWSGWLLVSEFDIALCAVLAAGLARLAWQRAQGVAAPVRLPPALTAAAFALAGYGLLGVVRGLWDAGGLGGGGAGAWFQGYGDPLNGLRVTKSCWEALLFVPLLHDALWRDRAGTLSRIGWGMFAGLACLCAAVLWERLAFPGFLDFSARYRTVGLFWEMHVGGAAIDGFLALSAPFAIWALQRSRRPLMWVLTAGMALLGVYACLTTFSRGVYLAVALPLLLLSVLLRAQRIGFDVRRLALRLLRMLAWLAGLWVLLAGALQVAGYPGAVAMLIALAALLWRAGHRRRPFGWWREASRTLVLAALIEVVMVLNGGSFMAARLSATDRDAGQRVEHWARGLALLQTPAQYGVGLGAGRLPAHYAAINARTEWSGAVLWQAADGDAPAHASLSGPRSSRRLSDLYALTQRVAPDMGRPHAVQLQVRAASPVTLHVFLCERHLLYEGDCQEAFLAVAARPGAWQTLGGVLRPSQAAGESAEDWRRPLRLGMLGLSVLEPGRTLDIARVEMADVSSGNRLRNPSFAEGLAHWFPASQYYFLPWHIDNLYLELLIERGAIGLALHLGLLLFAGWHLVVGRAAVLPAAPYLAASLAGAGLVGMFSSLLDMPRVAFLMYWLLWVSLLLTDRAGQVPAADRPPPGA